MDNVEQQIKYYKENLVSHGLSVKALGWSNETSQNVRFEVLSSIGNLNNHSILDVGCGFGDFYGYLKEKNIAPRDYLGIDLVEEMIEEACKRYPRADFETSNILDSCIGYYDYIFASGIFGLALPDWNSYVDTALDRMFSSCRIGVGVNFLGGTSGCCNIDAHYTTPLRVVEKIYKLSSKFVLYHNYKVNDFTVFIYK